MINYTGMTIGMITIIGRAPNNKHRNIQWYVDCECGRKNVIVSSNMLGRGLDHCGCKYSNVTKKRITATFGVAKKHSKFRLAQEIVLHPAITEFLRRRKDALPADQWYGPLPESRYCEIPQDAPQDRLEVLLRQLSSKNGRSEKEEQRIFPGSEIDREDI